MTTFTPGPWQAEPQGGRGAWIKGSNGEWAGLSCGDTDDRANDNARLIAAAPELYEALKALYDETVDYMRINHLGHPEDKHNLRLAAAALAKVEGRS